MRYPAHLLKLIDVLKRLPGVGNRSAERFAFELLNWPKERLAEMGNVVQAIPTRLRHCGECGCLIGEESCAFCDQSRENLRMICIIATPREAYSIEATKEYKGLYHVLGGVLSPIDGFDAHRLTIAKLKERIQKHQLTEVVIALDSTLEGDATSLYLKQELASLSVNVTRLAFGIPMGSSLDYVDGGTLARALMGRARF